MFEISTKFGITIYTQIEQKNVMPDLFHILQRRTIYKVICSDDMHSNNFNHLKVCYTS